jgi:hypothetical protein
MNCKHAEKEQRRELLSFLTFTRCQLKLKDDGMLLPGSVGLAPGFLLSIASEFTQEVEPFDEALDREMKSLYNQRLQWDLELLLKVENDCVRSLIFGESLRAPGRRPSRT